VTNVRRVVSVAIVIAFAGVAGVWLSAQSQTPPASKPSLTGAWTLNADLSDKPADRSQSGDDRGDRRGGGGGGGYGRRGGGGGGFGRGGGRGGFGGGGMGRPAQQDPQTVARMRDAMRDLTNPPDRLTIVETDSMIVITSPDGRTTRLAPDGKKVKDETTNIERKTKWDGGKLVSEISGLGPGKITQTFGLDPEQHQLRVVVLMEAMRGGQPRTITHVYEKDTSS